MTSLRRCGLGLVILLTTALVAQWYAPPPAIQPDPALLKQIEDRMEVLAKKLSDAKQYPINDDQLADVQIFLKAAGWITKHGEWYHKDYPQWTLAAVEQGIKRAESLIKLQLPWRKRPGRSVRGYYSRIDNTVQPYGVILPKSFDKAAAKQWRLDVVLHGRDASLTEIKFIHQHDENQPAPDQDFIQLNIYGRGNNAYRWAGEQDVLEAVRDFLDSGLVDPQRIVLRGFSMGGAGAWHLGLHHPDVWCSVSPGAGFSTTRGYIKNLADSLPPHQEACLHIYDAVDYAENAANVPVVAYGGEKDPQLQAARNIEARLKPLGIPFTLLVGPDTEHKYHPESLKELLRLQAGHAAEGRSTYPSQIRFVTWTPLYGDCHWVSVWAQEKQYARSLVEAEHGQEGIKVHTENVALLELTFPAPALAERVKVAIDGQTLSIRPERNLRRHVALLHKRGGGGQWEQTHRAKALTDLDRKPRKSVALMGPIDHAFTEPFLCVRGTGQPWHPAAQQFAEADLKRFQHEWSKFFRGELPVKDDVAVTQEDLERCHLILFGNPGSNELIRHALDRLPLRWDRATIAFDGQKYAASEHVPAMIYPSPFQMRRYVVLNSGHTFHASDFEGTNALLYPRLGDFAILKRTPTAQDPLRVEVVTAGLFDEGWQPPSK